MDRLLGRRPTRPLYHYTSLRGLRGILTSRAIWATDIKRLNDVTEFAHGIQLARNRVRSRRPRASPLERAFLDSVLEAMTFYDPSDQILPAHVASFCDRSDDLGLWRAYGRGGGFSIGYDWRADNRTEIILSKCVYDRRNKAMIIDELLEEYRTADPAKILEQFHSLGDRGVDATNPNRTRAIGCVLHFIMFSAALKNESFSSEREWRILIMPGSGFEPLPGSHRSTIAVPLALSGDLVIEKITVGPGPRAKERRAALERLLNRVPGVNCKSIHVSRVPLRGAERGHQG